MKTLFFKEKESYIFLLCILVLYFINMKLFIMSLLVTGFFSFFYRIPNLIYDKNEIIQYPAFPHTANIVGASLEIP